MENDFPFVITIVGAESSGKTVLAKQLADALSCVWVPEFAREYLEKLGRPYEIEDLEEIARGQWNLMPFKLPLHHFSSLSQKDSLPGPAFPPGPLNGVYGVFPGSMDKDISDFILALRDLKREVVIVDSGMLTIRMWARIKYGRTIPFVEEAMKNEPTSLYLLCRPRMDWERDPLREAPSLVDRAWIYNQYLFELVDKDLPYFIYRT